MRKPTAFLEIPREEPPKRAVEERIRDFHEFELLLPEHKLQQQASRCMDCGIPHCHMFGCPLGNRVPDWNDLTARGKWREALEILHSTNNFPEFTGRVCPAPCEASCTLAINQDPVTIREIERHLIERGWEEGWVVPEPAERRTGKRVAIVGSGPAGLAAAQQLARRGHDVVVFERADRPGGILRYGIPDFKLEKWVIDRRLEQLQAEGVSFEVEVEVGRDITARYLRRTFDAVVLAMGSTQPRDLDVPGRDLKGIHFAMDYLSQQNRVNAGDPVPEEERISAAGKHVVVIGGGDTGSDCVGTARRQGAASIVQIEILPRPPLERPVDNPWPLWPRVLRTSSSHEEGCQREWALLTKEFVGEDGHVRGVRVVELDWQQEPGNGKTAFREIPDSEHVLRADLVLLAMGFVHVEHGPLIRDTGIGLDPRGNVLVDANHMTTVPGVFAAGDAAQGASLVVRAIAQGRAAAEGVDRYLRGL